MTTMIKNTVLYFNENVKFSIDSSEGHPKCYKVNGTEVGLKEFIELYIAAFSSYVVKATFACHGAIAYGDYSLFFYGLKGNQFVRGSLENQQYKFLDSNYTFAWQQGSAEQCFLELDHMVALVENTF